MGLGIRRAVLRHSLTLFAQVGQNLPVQDLDFEGVGYFGHQTHVYNGSVHCLSCIKRDGQRND
jgi:hypothetical protein